MILEMIQGIFDGGAAIALLIFSGITLSCSAVVFLISTPIFIIFSPVLVPATIATTLLAAGFTASGSLITTAISIISWVIKKRAGGGMPNIPGLSPGIAQVKKEEKEKKNKRKGKKGEKDQKNMKKGKNMNQKMEKDEMKKTQKKGNVKGKKIDKMKE